jgi:hypothetical protein
VPDEASAMLRLKALGFLGKKLGFVVVFHTKPNVSPNGPLAPRITIISPCRMAGGSRSYTTPPPISSPRPRRGAM